MIGSHTILNFSLCLYLMVKTNGEKFFFVFMTAYSHQLSSSFDRALIKEYSTCMLIHGRQGLLSTCCDIFISCHLWLYWVFHKNWCCMVRSQKTQFLLHLVLTNNPLSCTNIYYQHQLYQLQVITAYIQGVSVADT